MGMIKLPPESVAYFEEHHGEIFQSGALAEGKWSEKVAEWTSQYTNSEFAHVVNSNGSGLLSLLSVLRQYYNKKRIFLQSNTMYGVRTIAISSGLELMGYVDCELDYLMPSYNQVLEFVTRLDNPSECVFLITHIGGWVNPDIERISKLCTTHGITLIEDCAHSLGSTLASKHTGLFGDAGVYSLYATKAIPVGEGGIIVTKSSDLHELVSKFSIYDRFDQELHIGVNNRMSELNALLAFAVLRNADAIIANKYKIADMYSSACDKYGWRYINPCADEQRANLYKFILISDADDPEEEFKTIKTRTSPVYDYALGSDSDDIVRRHICLPVWYGLEDDIIERVMTELVR